MENDEFILIDEYKTQNNISCITEEEIILLFGESCLYPNLYLPLWGREIYDAFAITDYEKYLLDKGFNIVEVTPKNEWQQKLADESRWKILQTEDTLNLGYSDFDQEGDWEYELEQEFISGEL